MEKEKTEKQIKWLQLRGKYTCVITAGVRSPQQGESVWRRKLLLTGRSHYQSRNDYIDDSNHELEKYLAKSQDSEMRNNSSGSTKQDGIWFL